MKDETFVPLKHKQGYEVVLWKKTELNLIRPLYLPSYRTEAKGHLKKLQSCKKQKQEYGNATG